MKYDENNIFAKILRGEIPCKKIYEDDLRDVYNSRTYCLYEDIELIKKS